MVLGVPTYVWRRVCRFNIVLVALLAALVFFLPSVHAQNFNNGGAGCSVRLVAPSSDHAFSVDGNSATTNVAVSGPANCRETLSLASWNAAIGSSGFVGQRFFAGKTFFNLGPGMHSLSIPINNSCTFQVDVILGSSQVSAAGNARYNTALLMGFTQVRGAVCRAAQPTQQSQPTPPPPAPTVNNICSGNTTSSQGGNCSTNTIQQNTQQQQTPSSTTPSTTTSTEEAQSSSQTAGPVSQTATQNSPEQSAAQQTASQTIPAATPSTLVNTGPGSVAAVFGVTSLISSLGYYGFSLRRSIRNL